MSRDHDDDGLPGRPGYEVTQESRFDDPDAKPARCPRCKHALITRNGDGKVIESLKLVAVVDHGNVCTFCAKALSYDHAPRNALIKTMRAPRMLELLDGGEE